MTELAEVLEIKNNNIIIKKLLYKCCLFKCKDHYYNSIREYNKIENATLNNLIETNNIHEYNKTMFNMKKEFNNNEIYRNYINCKITNCYPLTELYLNYIINKTPILYNYKKENEKFTVDDYINIKSKYNNFYS